MDISLALKIDRRFSELEDRVGKLENPPPSPPSRFKLMLDDLELGISRLYRSSQYVH